MPYRNTVRYGIGFASADHAVVCSQVKNSISSVFSTETTDAASSATADVTCPSAIGDLQYFGAADPFFALRFVFSTNPVAGVVTWEYWNGSAWTALSGVTARTGSVNLIGATHHIDWTMPTDWATTTVDSASAYWVRRRITTTYTTAGTASYISCAVAKTILNRTVYLPEATTRTINSVLLNLSYHDATGAGMQHVYASYRVNGGAWSAFVRNTNAHSATEDNSFGVQLAFVAGTFGTDIGSNTSFTLEVRTGYVARTPSGTSLAIENETGELLLTYTADEQQTRLKTVMIPLESGTGALGTSLGEIGTSQVPALTGGSGFLPESTVTIRDCYFIIEGGSGGDGTTDYQYAFRLAAEGETLSDTFEQGLASTPYIRLIWVKTPTDTTAATGFHMRTTVAGCGLNHAAIRMVVTYEYDHTNSTTILNSLLLAGEVAQAIVNGSVSPGLEVTIPFQVQEPATITLKQSGVMLCSGYQSSIGNIALSVGAQAFRTYTRDDGTQPNGTSLIQRLDSGSAQGAGHTLARGLNELQVRSYRGANVQTATSILVILNYTSGKHSSGAQVHNRTVVMANYNDQIAQTAVVVNSFSCSLPASWYQSSLFAEGDINGDASTQVATLMLELLSGEQPMCGLARDASFWPLVQFSPAGGTGVGRSPIALSLGHGFKQWSGDLRPLPAPGTARSLRYAGAHSWAAAWTIWSTFHAITYSTSRTLTGEGGTGSGLTVDVLDATTEEKIASVTTGTGGDWTYTDHDNTVSRKAICREDSTHVGMSDHFTPGT